VETGTLTAAPLVHAGWVVVASAGQLSAFRASDGSHVWRRAIGAIEFAPAIDGDVLFVPLVDGRLAALDVRTGDVRWELTLGGAPGEPLAAYGEVYVGANDKHFYVIDASDHRIRWQQLIGAGPRGRAAVDDDRVYYVALDNVLRTFKRSSGARLWMTRLTYRPAAGPVLISGVLVVPGPVSTLPVFGRDGSRVKEITFPSPLAGFSNVIDGNSTHPTVGIVTGDLEHPWTVSMLEPSYDPPAIPIVELTVLPGVTIEIAPPR
jgi:outer membrane protein assembly factor BamB